MLIRRVGAKASTGMSADNEWTNLLVDGWENFKNKHSLPKLLRTSCWTPKVDSLKSKPICESPRTINYLISLSEAFFLKHGGSRRLWTYSVAVSIHNFWWIRNPQSCKAKCSKRLEGLHIHTRFDCALPAPTASQLGFVVRKLSNAVRRHTPRGLKASDLSWRQALTRWIPTNICRTVGSIWHLWHLWHLGLWWVDASRVKHQSLTKQFQLSHAVDQTCSDYSTSTDMKQSFEAKLGGQKS